MYTKMTLPDSYVIAYRDETNEKLINTWLNAKETYSFSEYTQDTQLWHFGIIMFGENYSQIVPQLAFAKSVIDYKEFSPDDFAIVYPYFLGDCDVMAYIEYDKTQASLAHEIDKITQIPKEKLSYASSYLNKKWQEFENNKA